MGYPVTLGVPESFKITMTSQKYFNRTRVSARGETEVTFKWVIRSYKMRFLAFYGFCLPKKKLIYFSLQATKQGCYQSCQTLTQYQNANNSKMRRYILSFFLTGICFRTKFYQHLLKSICAHPEMNLCLLLNLLTQCLQVPRMYGSARCQGLGKSTKKNPGMAFRV